MKSITAVILTMNEARNIRRCLESLDGVADEVLVIDSGSTDKTQEICKELGARVISEDWKGYAATKNSGNALAACAYILSIDADEALSDELSQKILEEKKALSGAYAFNRLNNYCGKWIRHGGYYPDPKIRLFPKGQAKWEGGFVHEKLVLNTDLAVKDLGADLLHYSYYDKKEHLHRARKYARLGALKLAGRPKLMLIPALFFSPGIRFLKSFIVKAGFLDGREGFWLTAISSWEVVLKYWWAILGKVSQ